VLVLVDQDAVVADFDGGFELIWRERYPDRPFVEPAARRSFYIRDDYPAEYGDEIRAIHTAEGFISGLAPVQGALDALRAMLVVGHDVRICTSPLSTFRFCVTEKFQWVHDHLGADWVNRLIITKDKTLVRGDVLIDDKPEVTGALVPLWEHLVFEAPYNVGAPGRHINWGNWRGVLAEVEHGLC
jgi:5'-nucleotidase